MTAPKSISMADRVFSQLEDEILSGACPPGSVLTELAISDRLGVSRTPVREAIRRLEQENLVTASGKGVVVHGVSPQDLRDIYEIRMRIEGFAAAKAAAHATPDQLRELKEAVDLYEFYTSRSSAEQIKSTDTAFHARIFEACGSDTLRDILTLLHRRTQRYRKLSLEDPGRAAVAAGEHRAIYEAIAAGDAALAEQRTVQHIQNALNSILSKGGETEEY